MNTVTMVASAAQKSMLASIGAIALAGDTTAALLERLARRGEQATDNLRAQIERLFAQARTEAQATIELVEQPAAATRGGVARLRDSLYERLNLPSQGAVDTLRAELVRLQVALETLAQEQATAAPARPVQRRLPEPIAGYEQMNAETVLDRLRDLSEPTLIALRSYEQRHARRVTVLRSVERMLIERQAARGMLDQVSGMTSVEPFPHYNDLDEGTIIERCSGLNQSELLHVRTYEREHQQRAQLLETIDRRLAGAA